MVVPLRIIEKGGEPDIVVGSCIDDTFGFLLGRVKPCGEATRLMVFPRLSLPSRACQISRRCYRESYDSSEECCQGRDSGKLERNSDVSLHTIR